MWEHRLIEKIVPSLIREADRIKETNEVDTRFIDTAVDFFRLYADKTHHGKEENILFKELKKRNISSLHQRIMDELIHEHDLARSHVKGLIEANQAVREGDKSKGDIIVGHLRDLAALYPVHIEKENKRFFMPVLEYFSEEEQEKMLLDFESFDMSMIHWKYQQVIKNLTGELVSIRIEPQ